MKRALITGITGQDGSYLAELLLSKGYEVHGIIRRASTFNTARIDHIFEKLHLHYGDLSDGSRLVNLIARIEPDEIYNLAAQSHVRVSFDAPEYTTDIDATGTVRLLEAIREIGIMPKFYQACSSEMFGNAPPPQSELTHFAPRSPYGCAKVFSYWIARNYRESYNLPVTCGMLFNHESPRRGETFVTRKISRAVAAIKQGRENKLCIGNLEAKRDWGYAPEYVDGMWRMLQQSVGDDFVLATGESHSVREFIETAFAHVDLDCKEFIKYDARYQRPTEIDSLCGDTSKAKTFLKWEAKVRFHDLVALMVDAEMIDTRL